MKLVAGSCPSPDDLENLMRLPAEALHRLYRRVFNTDLPSGNSEQARRKIAWRLQARMEGELPESARQYGLAIARSAAVRIRNLKTIGDEPLVHATVTQLVSDHDSRIPMPGSVLVREYQGRSLVVHVLEAGFELDGRRFSSLSAVALEVTGTRWNGLAFFGLTKERKNGR